MSIADELSDCIREIEERLEIKEVHPDNWIYRTQVEKLLVHMEAVRMALDCFTPFKDPAELAEYVRDPEDFIRKWREANPPAA